MTTEATLDISSVPPIQILTSYAGEYCDHTKEVRADDAARQALSDLNKAHLDIQGCVQAVVGNNALAGGCRINLARGECRFMQNGKEEAFDLNRLLEGQPQDRSKIVSLFEQYREALQQCGFESADEPSLYRGSGASSNAPNLASQKLSNGWKKAVREAYGKVAQGDAATSQHQKLLEKVQQLRSYANLTKDQKREITAYMVDLIGWRSLLCAQDVQPWHSPRGDYIAFCEKHGVPPKALRSSQIRAMMKQPRGVSKTSSDSSLTLTFSFQQPPS